MFIYRYIDLQKYVKLKINIKFIISLIIVIAISCFLYYKNYLLGNVVNLLMIIIYSIIMNKSFLKGSINMIKEKIQKNM